MIPVDVSVKQTLDVDLKAIQQIDLNGNLDRGENTMMFFILWNMKICYLEFSLGTVRVL